MQWLSLDYSWLLYLTLKNNNFSSVLFFYLNFSFIVVNLFIRNKFSFHLKLRFTDSYFPLGFSLLSILLLFFSSLVTLKGPSFEMYLEVKAEKLMSLDLDVLTKHHDYPLILTYSFSTCFCLDL